MSLTRLPESAWIALLLLFLCCIYPPAVISEQAAKQSFLKGDCVYYRAIIVSLLQDHDLQMANNAPRLDDGQLALGRDGLVPKHPILMPIVSLPFYVLFGDFGLLLFNLIADAVLMLLIFKLNRLFFDSLTAFLTTVLYSTGTMFLEYSNNYSEDIFSTVLVVGGLYLLLTHRYAVAGFLLGLSIFAKVSNALPVALVLAYGVWSVLRPTPADETATATRTVTRQGAIGGMTIAFLLALLPFAYTNYHLFGSPFVTGYQRTVLGDYASGHATIINHFSKFNRPFFKGLVRLIFDGTRGALPTNPATVAALLGLFWIGRLKRPATAYLILAVCISQVLLFAKYDDWGKSHFSNRFLMTAIALSSVFAGNALTVLFQKFALTDSSKPAATA